MICERCKKDQDDSKFTSSSDGGRLPWCSGCRLTAAIRAEIVGPADGASWDELGDRLRDLRAVSHRILNAGTCVDPRRALRAVLFGEPRRTSSGGHLRETKKPRMTRGLSERFEGGLERNRIRCLTF